MKLPHLDHSIQNTLAQCHVMLCFDSTLCSNGACFAPWNQRKQAEQPLHFLIESFLLGLIWMQSYSDYSSYLGYLFVVTLPAQSIDDILVFSAVAERL